MIEIVSIPEKWEFVRIEEITLGLIGGGTPSTSQPDYWDGDIPWMTSANLTDRIILGGMRNITEKGLRNSATNIVPKGSLLISTRVGIGKVGIAGINIAISQDLTGLVLDNDKVDVEYLYWAFLNQSSHLGLLSQGSTIKGLTRDYLKNLRFFLPPLPEQKKIAEILSTVDQAIEKVDEAIEKAQRLKKGLMQELLTNGIGHKEFKDTEIGRIPKEWEVKKLINIGTLQRGHDLPNQERIKGKYPVIGSNGVVGYHSVYKVKGPGVIIGRSGTLGKVYFSSDDYWPLNTSLYVIDFHGNSPIFVYYFFQYIDMSQFFAGTGVPTLNRNLLHPIKFAIANLPEQQKIAEILSALDERIDLLRTRKEKLEMIKKGLMNDLLTGRKRLRLEV
jgi:type I restriction enzyme S subunit